MEKINVNKKENKVILNFRTEFYDIQSVMEATQAYSESCWTYLDGDASNVIQVVLSPKKKETDLKIMGYEFYNHVLSVMKDAGRLRV